MTNEPGATKNEPGALLTHEPPRHAEDQTEDGRTHALYRLRLYISLLLFYRRGDRGGPPVPFRVPIENIHVEQPDDVKDLKLPAIAFLSAPAKHEERGLGPPTIDEASADAGGTALAHASDHVEMLAVEVMSAYPAERRALLAGLRRALRASDRSYGIAMRLPSYHGAIAQFWLDESQPVDDPDVVRGRRRALLRVWLTVPELSLVRVPRMSPVASVVVREAGEPDA